jgi:hypothetical protein
MWMTGPTFEEDKWTRYTATDGPGGYAWETAGAKPWNILNTIWEEYPKGWIAPMNMDNWTDQDLYSDNRHLYYRYLITFYYGVLNIG